MARIDDSATPTERDPILTRIIDARPERRFAQELTKEIR